jgi:glycine/D-amino acid oxidase-like deaminating enzyme
MTDRFDLAVVGGGIVGAAVAFHTARLGGRVVVLDKSSDVGATDRSSGIVRVHQPDLELAPLSHLGWREYAHWEDVVERASTFRRVGCVHATPGRDFAADMLDMRALDWECSIVGASELGAMYPQVAWAPATTAVFEPNAGYADAAMCRRQYLDWIEELGGSVRRVAVRGLVRSRGAVTGVQTDVERISAGAVVLATGGWAAFDALPPAPPVDIRARRIVWQGAPGSFASLPCYVREGTEALYFRPTEDGGVRFGVGCNDWDVAPEAALRGIDDDLLERGRDRVAGLLGVRPATTTLISAVDGYTADQRPVIDRWPDIEGLYVALGFSGGGFKLAPAVGALLARWVAHGTPDPRLAPFTAARLLDRPLATAGSDRGRD